MRGWIASRLLQTVLVVFLSLTAVFGRVRLAGDPVLLFMPMDIQAKDVNEYRERLGFNDPLLVQYARFMRGAVRGDFGERSEEHTSELQSQSNLVCRLLLEKKKNEHTYAPFRRLATGDEGNCWHA